MRTIDRDDRNFGVNCGLVHDLEGRDAAFRKRSCSVDHLERDSGSTRSDRAPAGRAPDLAGGQLGRKLTQAAAVGLLAVSLAACAQSSVVNRQAGLAAPPRQAMLEPPRREVRHIARASIVRLREPEKRTAVAGPGGLRGVASFYTEGQQTASGERFDPHELTAAHPSLPFGTRLQVTNVTTGKSVVVRVNDRGPFVKGRVVDVSYSAAEALGMTHSGVANVKLDVVR